MKFGWRGQRLDSVNAGQVRSSGRFFQQFSRSCPRLILSDVHIRIVLVSWSFWYLLSRSLGPEKPASDPVAVAKIPGGVGSVRKPEVHFSRGAAVFACLMGVLGLVVLGAPPRSDASVEAARQSVLAAASIHNLSALPSAVLFSAGQEGGQSAAPASGQGQPDSQAAPAPAAPLAPKPVVLPEGDGKPIATEFCQDCHKLTNLTRAHKDLDDWKDTIHTMMDRGARIPDEKIDTLAQYLFTNFGPKPATTEANAAAAQAPATAAPSNSADPGAAASAVSPAATPAKAIVELPDGDGKAIATENCQACHKLTNLTKAHKDLDDWKDTVQTMIDRGANVPPDKVDILVQYLAKNFGPKDASAPALVAPAPAN
jgi:cytochrome c5